MPMHGQHPCVSCPFRREADHYFEPSTLDQTVGKNLRSETYVHKCHKGLGKSVETLCVGFLRFVRDQDVPSQLTQVGVRMGVIDYDIISDNVPIATSWEEILEIHAQRERGMK